MKIGLVTPYVYPLPGGVTQHVRYLYENLRLRGHDVRIITSSHGLQRASEGDIIRIGKGFSMPVNGSVGTITLSPRFISQVRDMLEREQFDLLHFHEPFVPFLSPIVLRLSTSVNIATFHAYGGFSPSYEFGSRAMRGYAARLHGRIAVSGAAKHFIERYFPGDYKVIPNGVDIDRFQRAVPIARWQDGTSNILFVGRFEPRKGLLELLKAYRILRKTGCDCRLLVVGSGPARQARRGATSRPAGSAAWSSSAGSSDEEKAQLFRTADVYVSPGHRRRIVRDRPPRGDGRGHRDRRVRHPRLQGRRPARPRGPPRAAARAEGASPRAIGRLLARRRACDAAMGDAGRLRAEEFCWPRVTAKVDDFYGVVIRRLAARGELPPGFHAPIPASPRLPRDATASAGRGDGRRAGRDLPDPVTAGLASVLRPED